MALPGWATTILQVFRSRKARWGLVAVVVAAARQAGLEIDETTLFTVLTACVAMMLGIAIEDAGEKSSAATEREDHGGASQSQ